MTNPEPGATPDPPVVRVNVVGVDVPLVDLVALTFKLAIAALPLAAVVVSLWYLAAIQ
jgi:hypothetical protein